MPWRAGVSRTAPSGVDGHSPCSTRPQASSSGRGAQTRLRLEQPARLLAGLAREPGADGVEQPPARPQQARARRAAGGAAARPARRRRAARAASARPGCAASSRCRCRVRRPARDRSDPSGARARDRARPAACAPRRCARPRGAGAPPRAGCARRARRTRRAARARASPPPARASCRRRRRTGRAPAPRAAPRAGAPRSARLRPAPRSSPGGRLPARRPRARRAGADRPARTASASLRRPAAASERTACSRVAASVFTRRSSGAGSRRAASSRSSRRRTAARAPPAATRDIRGARRAAAPGCSSSTARERRHQGALRRAQPLRMPGRAAEDPREPRPASSPRAAAAPRERACAAAAARPPRWIHQSSAARRRSQRCTRSWTAWRSARESRARAAMERGEGDVGRRRAALQLREQLERGPHARALAASARPAHSIRAVIVSTRSSRVLSAPGAREGIEARGALRAAQPADHHRLARLDDQRGDRLGRLDPAVARGSAPRTGAARAARGRRPARGRAPPGRSPPGPGSSPRRRRPRVVSGRGLAGGDPRRVPLEDADRARQGSRWPRAALGAAAPRARARRPPGRSDCRCAPRRWRRPNRCGGPRSRDRSRAATGTRAPPCAAPGPARRAARARCAAARGRSQSSTSELRARIDDDPSLAPERRLGVGKQLLGACGAARGRPRPGRAPALGAAEAQRERSTPKSTARLRAHRLPPGSALGRRTLRARSRTSL